MTRRESWRDHARCAGIPQTVYFDHIDERGTRQAVVALCEACPVRAACLALALEREGRELPSHRFGIWGGKTPRQRYKIAKSLRETGGSLREREEV